MPKKTERLNAEIEKRKSAKVEIVDIKRCYKLFVDVKRSTQYLMEYNKEYMYNELDDDNDEYADEDADTDKKEDSMETSP